MGIKPDPELDAFMRAQVGAHTHAHVCAHTLAAIVHAARLPVGLMPPKASLAWAASAARAESAGGGRKERLGPYATSPHGSAARPPRPTPHT